MLEFHPTLAFAAHIPTALKHAYWVRSDLLNLLQHTFYYISTV